MHRFTFHFIKFDWFKNNCSQSTMGAGVRTSLAFRMLTFMKQNINMSLPGYTSRPPKPLSDYPVTLQWRNNERDGVPYHQPHHCLLNRLFRRRSKKTSKLRVTGLCAGNSPVTSEFPVEWSVTRKMFPFKWRHHAYNTFVRDLVADRDWFNQHWTLLFNSIVIAYI